VGGGVGRDVIVHMIMGFFVFMCYYVQYGGHEHCMAMLYGLYAMLKKKEWGKKGTD
jgi:hypothetical protein